MGKVAPLCLSASQEVTRCNKSASCRRYGADEPQINTANGSREEQLMVSHPASLYTPRLLSSGGRREVEPPQAANQITPTTDSVYNLLIMSIIISGGSQFGSGRRAAQSGGCKTQVVFDISLAGLHWTQWLLIKKLLVFQSLW